MKIKPILRASDDRGSSLTTHSKPPNGASRRTPHDSRPKAMNIEEIYKSNRRIHWIGEDEQGRVAAVGEHLLFLEPKGCLAVQDYKGYPLECLVSGKLLTFVHSEMKTDVMLSETYLSSFYDGELDGHCSACYDSSKNTIYIIGRRNLVSVNACTGESLVIDDVKYESDMHSRYERILTFNGYIIAFGYGMCIWKENIKVAETEQWPYGEVAVSSGGGDSSRDR